MDVEKIKEFVDSEYDRLLKYYAKDSDSCRFPMLAKLMEEVGGLSSEVLAHSNLQRKDKLDNHDKNNISEEFADCLLVTMLLSKNMGVDIFDALENKIETIKKRNY